MAKQMINPETETPPILPPMETGSGHGAGIPGKPFPWWLLFVAFLVVWEKK